MILMTKQLVKYTYSKLYSRKIFLLKLAILKLGISARDYDKILWIFKTMADLETKDIVEVHHISETIGYRSLDSNL